MFNKIYLFSHNDLDGYACNIVVDTFSTLPALRNNGIKTYNTDYQNIDSLLSHTLETEVDPDRDLVIISDMSWNRSRQDITNRLRRQRFLIVADHHKTSEWIGNEFEDVIETEDEAHFDMLRLSYTKDGDFCGSVILRHQLMRLNDYIVIQCNQSFYNNIKRLDDFLNIVNDWDVDFGWSNGLDISSPEKLLFDDNIICPRMNLMCQFDNNLFCKRVKRFIMGNLMTINEVFDDGSFKDYIRRVSTELKNSLKYYHRMTIRSVDDRFYDTNTVLFTCRIGNTCDKSLLAYLAYNTLKKNNITDYDCIAIWEVTKDTISLRYGQCDLDLSVVAKNSPLGGGGHRFAAGMHVDPSEMYRVVDYSNAYILTD